MKKIVSKFSLSLGMFILSLGAPAFAYEDWNNYTGLHGFDGTDESDIYRWSDIHENGKVFPSSGELIHDGVSYTWDNYDGDLVLVDGEWDNAADGVPYTIDGDELQTSWYSIKLVSDTDISGQTLSISSYHDVNVTFSAGARRYAIESQDFENYELWWVPQYQTPSGWEDFTSFLDYRDWPWVFYDESTETGAGFKNGESESAISGQLTTKVWDYSSRYVDDVVIGTWAYTNLPGQSGSATIVFTIDNEYKERFTEGYEDGVDYMFATIYNGKVYRGVHKTGHEGFISSGSDEFIGNRQAYDDIVNAINEELEISEEDPSSNPAVIMYLLN